MELRHTIKQNAKKALSGFWGQAVAIALLVVGYQLLLLIAETLLMSLLDSPPYIDIHGTPDNPFDDSPNISPTAFLLLCGGWLLAFLVGTPLNFGVRRWFYVRGGGYRPDFSDVFYYFDSASAFFKTLWVELNITVRSLMWGLLFIAPGLTCTLLGKWAARSAAVDSEAMLATGLTVSGIIILCGGALLLAVFLQRFALAHYLCFEDEAISAGQAIRLSVRGTRGNRASITLFMLSFAGWGLLCCLGLPLLYVLPYFFMSHSIYVRLLITQNDLMSHLRDIRRDEEQAREDARQLDDQQMGKSSPV